MREGLVYRPNMTPFSQKNDQQKKTRPVSQSGRGRGEEDWKKKLKVEEHGVMRAAWKDRGIEGGREGGREELFFGALFFSAR